MMNVLMMHVAYSIGLQQANLEDLTRQHTHTLKGQSLAKKHDNDA